MSVVYSAGIAVGFKVSANQVPKYLDIYELSYELEENHRDVGLTHVSYGDGADNGGVIFTSKDLHQETRDIVYTAKADLVSEHLRDEELHEGLKAVLTEALGDQPFFETMEFGLWFYACVS